MAKIKPPHINRTQKNQTPRTKNTADQALLGKTFSDGFSNIIAGLGAANLKQAADTYTDDINPAEIEKAYRASTWFGKIVDIPAFDATREGRTWKADKDMVNQIERVEKKLNLLPVLRQALVYMRLYGGAVIIPGGLPGANSEPLCLENVQKGSLKSLTVLSRHEIFYDGVNRDPFSPLCGKPLMWRLKGQQDGKAGGGDIALHPSRVIMLSGRKSVHSKGGHNSLWGDGIWLHLRDAVTAADSGASILSSLMKEAKVDIYGLPDMMSQMQTADYENALMQRFMMTNMMKSVSNIVVKDASDTWEQKTIDFSGLPDVMTTLLTIMAGAADIPVTRLIGKSASGLSATGEHDMKNYYDAVKAMQEMELAPAITILDELIIRSALGVYPGDIWYEWKSLWQPTEKEKAESARLKAEVSALYAQSGLFDPKALASAIEAQLIEDGVYPSFSAVSNTKENHKETESKQL